MADIIFSPGVVKETTAYDVGQGFVDSNLIRWRNGKAATINGWYQRAISPYISGVCRCIKEFSTLSGSDLVAFGTNSNAYILTGDTIYDITPSGFVAGPVSAAVANGFGIGTYGTPGASGLGYGLPRVPSSDPFAQIITQPLIWSMDNFGENLVCCPYAGSERPGALYEWLPAGGYGQKMTPIASNSLSDGGIPPWSRGAFVSTQTQCVVAVGTTPYGQNSPDPMQIRWSDFANYYVWIPSAANNAGDYRLPSGSYIVGWLNTYYETLFFTDTTVYSMQLLTNGLVFGFNPVGQGMSMISSRAAYSNGSVTFWMDNGSFYMYSGTVSELPCPLKSFLFGDGSGGGEKTGNLDRSQAFKVYAGGNHSYSEVWWFYQSVNGTEIDSYVSFNYASGLWANGTLGRTAWSDSGHLENPIATDASGNVYMHEYGVDQQLTSGTVALPFSLTTGDFCIDSGDTFVTVFRLICDMLWQGPSSVYQKLLCDIRVRNSSAQTPRVAKTICITQAITNGGYSDFMVRGRRVSFRFYSDGVPGTSWTMGKFQGQYFASGKR